MTVTDSAPQETAASGGAPPMAEYIDRLVTVEMRNRGMPANKIAPLYEAARAEGGGGPLAFRAAEGLVRAAGAGSRVLIVTGAGSGALIPKGENDGPVGAAVLARALLFGSGALPVLVCEEHHADPIVAACLAAGVELRSPDTFLSAKTGGTLITAPTDQDDVEAWAETVFDRFSPSAIISIERLGPNRKGVVHGATGLSGWDPMVDVAPLFAVAKRRDVFSVGIGDAGNEIGFGRIIDAVRRIQPQGAECQCPCGDGMATVVPTDVLVVAAVSNWGAYAIEACIAMLLGRSDLVHTPEEARRIILSCLDAGGLEAMLCTRRFLVDGIGGDVSVSLVQILGEMARIHLEEPDRGVIH